MSRIQYGVLSIVLLIPMLTGTLLAQGNAAGGGTAQAPTPTTTAVVDTAVKGEARDPVCGMVTKTEGQPSEVYRDTRFHFCSAKCHETFKADPSKTATGLPGEQCMCSRGQMKNCKCDHCTGKPERCLCGDPGHGEKGSESEHGEHDHSTHQH